MISPIDRRSELSPNECVIRSRTCPLPRRPDPLALYAALSDDGARTDTMLFERSDGPSLLLDRAALRMECRGRDVRLLALSAGGRCALDMLARRLSNRVAERTQDRMLLRFPPIDGDDAEARLRAPSPFDAIRALVGLECDDGREPFAISCPGVIAYDHVDLFERLPVAAEDPLGFPDFVFWLAESLIAFEPDGTARAICTGFGACGGAAAEAGLTSLLARCAAAGQASAAASPGAPDFSDTDLDDAAYAALAGRLKAHIAAGDVYQIVPSRTFRAPCPDPLRAFAALRALDRTRYRFFVAGERYALFGASPEAAVQVQCDGRVVVTPIAGTRPRGSSADEDNRLEAELRSDAKELAEHLMLVDLVRNDVARISVAGSRHVAALMEVTRHARVMHLASRVEAKLRSGLDAFHAVQACLNVGTLTGTPKIRAMALLRRAELGKRGPYGGAIGWFNRRGEMDSAVIIRSAIVADGIASVRAGAGIVHDSEPLAEADETSRKAAAILSALAGAAK